MSIEFDLLIKDGIFFDGLGNKPVQRDVAIHGGKILKIGNNITGNFQKTINAKGLWVTPGFVDIHTHYDLEVEIAPGLKESLRHGVTTVIMGNCSLSITLGNPTHLADIFIRVECLPDELVRAWLMQAVNWQSSKEYFDHLNTLPIAANVSAMLGHSALRCAVMGLERSLSEQPTAHELDAMCDLAEQALKAGCIGISIDMVYWHKVSGEYEGRALPSHHAQYEEYRRLCEVCRRYDAVVQVTPNPLNKKTILYLFWLSIGVWCPPLRMTILSALDMENSPKLWRLFPMSLFFLNQILGCNIRFQTLTEPFTIYADGPITPLFEEFSTGVLLNSCKDSSSRKKLWEDELFCEKFQNEWHGNAIVFHKKLNLIYIVSAPDQSLIDKSIDEIAKGQGMDPLATFINLLKQYDTELRWKTTGANNRKHIRQKLVAHKHIFPGFTDAGAHCRNLAFFDGALTLLRDSINDSFMTPERAIARVTSEPALWFGLDAGVLKEGTTADFLLLNPEALSTYAAKIDIIDDPALGGASRMVKRGSEAVFESIFISGQEMAKQGVFTDIHATQKVGRILTQARRYKDPKEIHKAYRNRIRNDSADPIFNEYWPVFVLKHSNPLNVVMHCIAVILMYAIPFYACITNQWLLLCCLPFSQMVGLVGHVFFERTHVDLRDLFFSWRALFSLNRMFFLVLLGRYSSEIHKYQSIYSER